MMSRNKFLILNCFISYIFACFYSVLVCLEISISVKTPQLLILLANLAFIPFVFLIDKKAKNHKKLNYKTTKYKFLKFLFAYGIDFFIYLILFLITALILGYTKKLSLYYFSMTLLFNYFLLDNNCFTSVGFRLLKIQNEKQSFLYLLIRLLYLGLLVLVFFNNMVTRIIVLAFLSIDYNLIFVLQKSLLYFIFKVNIIEYE